MQKRIGRIVDESQLKSEQLQKQSELRQPIVERCEVIEREECYDEYDKYLMSVLDWESPANIPDD